MTHRFDPKNMQRLDNPERRELLPPSRVLADMGLSAGHAFLDIGAGIGYFSLPALEIVGPGGRVAATDVSAEMLEELKRRAGSASPNIEFLHCPSTRLPLPDGEIDMALMAFVLHEVEDRAGLLAEILRVLKKGGRLAVIEWKMKEPPPGPPPAERIAPDETAGLCEKAGLAPVRREEVNAHHYLVLCEKR
ncbi:MAG: class I SAM-dependent methyltransferase [Spirochaetes bacterium]|jgi:ubiquinone/menaquinone biosynthesis C-methylase UbiE|nr:class I SAM-dependent methyltransferase [Spirochaetota bacterium]